MRCDRIPRGDPARIELAPGVPRVRPTGCSRGARRAGRTGSGRASKGGSAARARDAGAARTPLARLRLGSRCGRARATHPRAAPAGAADRAVGARPRGEPRLALPRRLPARARAVRAPRRPSSRLGAGPRNMAVAADTLERLAYAALAEDVGEGDATTEAVVHADASGSASILLKEPGVVCGLLTGERTALNYLGRLCGIATLTRRYVDAVEGPGVAILDTRKTTPGLRILEKPAVAVGGGRNHRLGLDDGVLIKDNHLRTAVSIREAVESAREATHLPVEVECDTIEQVSEALDAGADAILLDNMTPDGLLAAAVLARGRARLEASGGVALDNVRAIAENGVDEISVGALTHSARSLDVSLELT